MKVTNVETHLWDPGQGKNFLFVKIETDDGIVGWGEAYTQADRDTQVEAHVKQIARYLEGRDPFHIRHFMHVVHEDFATKRGGNGSALRYERYRDRACGISSGRQWEGLFTICWEVRLGRG